jgi:hypothetical protein
LVKYFAHRIPRWLKAAQYGFLQDKNQCFLLAKNAIKAFSQTIEEILRVPVFPYGLPMKESRSELTK